MTQRTQKNSQRMQVLFGRARPRGYPVPLPMSSFAPSAFLRVLCVRLLGLVPASAYFTSSEFSCARSSGSKVPAACRNFRLPSSTL